MHISKSESTITSEILDTWGPGMPSLSLHVGFKTDGVLRTFGRAEVYLIQIGWAKFVDRNGGFTPDGRRPPMSTFPQSAVIYGSYVMGINLQDYRVHRTQSV